MKIEKLKKFPFHISHIAILLFLILIPMTLVLSYLNQEIFECVGIAALVCVATLLLSGILILRQMYRLGEKKRSMEEKLRLWAKVFENSGEGILITAKDGTIEDVNAAFTEITGYGKEEVVGKQPSILKSDRHDKDFYLNMWHSLFAEGQWRGEIWDRRKNGEVYPKWLSVAAVRDRENVITHFVGVFSDISSVKQSEARLEQLAHYDFLTGLPNRILFYERFTQAIREAEQRNVMAALLFADLDQFKLVNDSLGHRAGDQLLIQVAERLAACVSEEENRKNDTMKTASVSRLGGDEFTVVLTNVSDAARVARAAEKIVSLFQIPFVLEEGEVFISPSIGITLFPEDGREPELLIKNADTAMYHAKELGRNNYQFFSQKLYARASERLTMETKLRNALAENKLFLYYQPKVNLGTGKISGAEALIRWLDEDSRFISPDKFIPVAEETGLIFPLFDGVLEHIRQITPKVREALGRNTFRIAVNLSSRQFQDRNLIQKFGDLILNGIHAGSIETEITEGTVMRDPNESVNMLNALKDMGICSSIDDFGTGYSSLSYLKRFPIEALKIDRSFIKGIPVDTDDMIIVKSIIALGHSMDIRIVAEGAETKEQVDFLLNEDCDEIQGYYFYRPLPEAEFLSVLEKENV